MAPSIEEAERMCNPRIHRSTPCGFGPVRLEGERDVAGPAGIGVGQDQDDAGGGIIQNAIALIRGRAISFAPIIDGTR